MSSSSQFLVSMKFMGIDALSPTMQKMTQQVKQMKDQVNGLGSGPSGGFKFINQMSAGLKASVKLLDDLQGKFDKMKSSGFGNIITGTAMVAPIMKALNDAGQMQTKMVTISGATGVKDTKAIQDVIRAASSVTKFSSNEVADLAVKLATSGMTGDQVKSLTPVMAKFAEVQQFGKGSAPEESVTQAISSAHMLGIYDPKLLDAYLDKFNKATFMTPGSTSEFFDTFKYMAPTAKGMGMSNNDILYTSALANRVGLLGSMGGTESADMILRSIPGIFGGNGQVGKNGKFKPSKQLGAMMDLGLAKADGSSVFFNNKGEFQGIENFIKKLSDASKGVNPEQLMKDFKNMFGMQGEKLAVILSERGGEQLQLIEQQMANMKSMTQMQGDYNQSYQGQLAQFETNLKNLSQDVGGALLPTATNLLKTLQPQVALASQWIQTHKDEVEKIAKVAAELGGFLLVLGTAKIAMGTVGTLLTGPVKLALSTFSGALDTFKAKTVAKDLAPQAIQANIVNVYGRTVNGGAGGIAGEGGAVVEGGLPPRGSTTKVGKLATAGNAFWGVGKGALKRGAGMLPIGLAFGAYDVMTAPEGKKVETAAKASGGIIGGWAGAEAGAAMGAALGSVVPVLGTGIGALLGGIIGGVAGGYFGDKFASSAYDAIAKTKVAQTALDEPFSRAKYNAMQNEAQKNQTINDHSTYHINVQSNEPDAAAAKVHALILGNHSKASWQAQSGF